MRRSVRLTSITLAAALTALLGAAAAVRGGPDPDDADLDDRLASGLLAFRDNCLMCHSVEMTSRLRLSGTQWAAEVDKMVGWGAPVPPDLKGPLLDYLVSRFSDPKAAPVPPAERTTLREALSLELPERPRPIAGDATRGAALYAANCATCHGPEARGGDPGTCLVEKPILLRPDDYIRGVRKGLRRMPGFELLLKPAQEADILVWLRSLRFDAPSP